MSGNNFLLDTNIVLYLLSGDETLADFLFDKQLYLSVITEMELLSFKGLDSQEEIKINAFLSECKVVNINSIIKSNVIRIRKKYGKKLPDCIIAGTALFLDLPLFTADKDFREIKELELVYYER